MDDKTIVKKIERSKDLANLHYHDRIKLYSLNSDGLAGCYRIALLLNFKKY